MARGVAPTCADHVGHVELIGDAAADSVGAMTEAENVSVDVLFEGVVLAQGVALRAGEAGLFAPMPAPMPVGTRLDLAQGEARHVVRVARVSETGDVGMFLVGEHGARLALSSLAVHAATPVRPVHVEQPISFEIKAEESVPVVAPPTAGVRVRGPGLESMMDDAPAEEPTSFEVKAEAPAVDATIEAPPVEAKVEAPAVEPKVEAPAPVEVKAEAPVHEAPAAEPEASTAEAKVEPSGEGEGDSGGGKRKKFLQTDALSPYTLIYYESPFRLRETLQDMRTIFGDRVAALANDLTKMFERVDRGTLSELLQGLPEGDLKGEFVVVVEGCNTNSEPPNGPEPVE